MHSFYVFTLGGWLDFVSLSSFKIALPILRKITIKLFYLFIRVNENFDTKEMEEIQ